MMEPWFADFDGKMLYRCWGTDDCRCDIMATTDELGGVN